MLEQVRTASDDSLLASPQLLQEVNQTVQRSRPGGFFYLFLWGLTGWASGLWRSAPGLWIGVGAVFAVLAVERLSARGTDESLAAATAKLDRVWALILATALFWSVVTAWLLLGSQDQSARIAIAISTYAIAIASAHSYNMRLNRAYAAISFLYVPTLVAFIATMPQIEIEIEIVIVIVGLLSLAYAVVVASRGNAEYTRRLKLEDELRQQRDLYEQQSRRDGLTGLANRRRFSATLRNWIDEARARGASLALLILDLDHFKTINDKHGHATGDACLRAFADLMKTQFGADDDLPARLGGEEFAVLMRNCGGEDALHRAEAFRSLLENVPLRMGGVAMPVRVSIGVAATQGLHLIDGEALCNAADGALYRAKASGRNNVQSA